jgi:hypothetical protein
MTEMPSGLAQVTFSILELMTAARHEHQHHCSPEISPHTGPNLKLIAYQWDGDS